MRVMITGAAGFAGRHLADHCSGQGATVVGIGRRAPGDLDAPPTLDSYLPADLLDPQQAEQAVRSAAPDRVFHLAAEASVARSWQDPAQIVLNNVHSTLNLLEAVRQRVPEASILIAGSGEQYGPPEELPVDEGHPLRPQNPYAVSKTAADLAAGFYADAYGLRVVRTRAFNHTGPGQSATYVVANFARQIAEAEAAENSRGRIEVLTGNADVRRDFADVRDVVRGYWLALEHAEPGVYNICSGHSTAIADILAGLARHTELDVEQRVDQERLREHEVMEIQGSHEKLTEATGWTPELTLAQTLRDTLDWWRERTAVEVTR